MSNYPAGAQNDTSAPWNTPDEQYDYQCRDMAVADLETILKRVKNSNGIFTNKFYESIEEMLNQTLEL